LIACAPFFFRLFGGVPPFGFLAFPALAFRSLHPLSPPLCFADSLIFLLASRFHFAVTSFRIEPSELTLLLFLFLFLFLFRSALCLARHHPVLLLLFGGAPFDFHTASLFCFARSAGRLLACATLAFGLLCHAALHFDSLSFTALLFLLPLLAFRLHTPLAFGLAGGADALGFLARAALALGAYLGLSTACRLFELQRPCAFRFQSLPARALRLFLRSSLFGGALGGNSLHLGLALTLAAGDLPHLFPLLLPSQLPGIYLGRQSLYRRFTLGNGLRNLVACLCQAGRNCANGFGKETIRSRFGFAVPKMGRSRFQRQGLPLADLEHALLHEHIGALLPGQFGGALQRLLARTRVHSNLEFGGADAQVAGRYDLDGVAGVEQVLLYCGCIFRTAGNESSQGHALPRFLKFRRVGPKGRIRRSNLDSRQVKEGGQRTQNSVNHKVT
jgi:hypothetical protein